MADKIVEGRMQKFYEEICLLEQPFVKEATLTVGQLVKTKIAKLVRISLWRVSFASKWRYGRGGSGAGGIVQPTSASC